jgi:hypothetical protein
MFDATGNDTVRVITRDALYDRIIVRAGPRVRDEPDAFVELVLRCSRHLTSSVANCCWVT